MTYKGTVHNGVVVLPPDAHLPEGAEVMVEQVAPVAEDPFIAAARRVAKPRPHWPKDYVRNLDHYLYGADKEL